MARHTAIAATPGTKIYFCDSRSPWQGPSNENTNGLLRQYFPKGTDLSVHPPAHLVAVEDELNRRPRMVLEDRAPIDLFQALLASSPRRCCDVDWNSPRCEVLSIQPVPTDEVTWGVTPPALRGSVKGHRLDNGQAVAGSIRAGCLMPPLCGPPTARITASSMTYRIRIPTASGVITGGRGRSRPRDPGLIGHFIRRYWQGTTAARHTSTSPLAPAAPDVRRSRRPDVTRALIARN